MASVYRAGAAQQRVYGYNMERQQQAEALEAQARRCDEIAAGRDAATDLTRADDA